MSNTLHSAEMNFNGENRKNIGQTIKETDKQRNEYEQNSIDFKSKVDMKSISLTPTQRFWRLLKPDQKEITNVYIYSIFNGLVSLSLPLGIQAIVNLIQGGQVSTSWIVLVGIVVVGVALSGLFQIYQLKITEQLQQKIFTRAAFEFAFRMPRIKMSALYNHYAPELMNRFFDIVSVQKGLSKILIDFSSASIQVIFGLILLSFYHPFFILFSLLLISVIYIIMRISIPNGLKTSLEESKYKYAVVHWLEEVARVSTTFKLAGDSPLPMSRTNEHVEDYLDARNSHFSILLRHYSLLVFFKILVATGLLAIGGILVIEQHMNIGQFVAAEIIILLVMSSVEKLIMSIETIYDVLTSLEKIGQVTDLELENSDGIKISGNTEWQGLRLELMQVSFVYPDYAKQILDDLNLSVAESERILITGENGSGKSTLLQIVAGLYSPISGNIAYDGSPIGSLNINDLQSVIGDCLSQEKLFQGSVLENITMGREDATPTNVLWAISNLGLESFIKTLDKGIDTSVGPHGRKLPMSVQQKLILARSIVDRPRLLLLEDALEHVDTLERRRIIDFLFDKRNPWTIISVSNSEYMSEKADRVLILSEGKKLTEKIRTNKSKS
ncbi:MAG: ABC-type bacteriocin/lantibiotic exporter with double-glycine peptidase domain [Patiriisocius sp.]|jgi:ABC-type bacteriocin/lantibiotic exporter with double-glycine peptidase domain